MQVSFTSNGPETALHHLDVRTKMLISAVASIVVILLKSVPALALLSLASCCYLMLTRRWRVMVISWLVILLLWITAVGFMNLMHLIMPKMGATGMANMLIPFLRSLVLVNTLLAMALSTRIQGILTTLRSLHLPYWLYIPAAVMVRFLPSLVEDMRQIAEAVRIKGYPLNPAALLFSPWQTIRLLFVPMLFRALRTSDDLGIAAELKGVGYGSTISRFREQHFSRFDYGILAVSCTFFVLSLVINAYSKVTTFMGM